MLAWRISANAMTGTDLMLRYKSYASAVIITVALD